MVVSISEDQIEKSYVTVPFLKSKAKERNNRVNEIESVYIKEGIYSSTFTKHLISFIGYILNRYSNGASFPDDMVHFTYLRVMERLGASLPEMPKEEEEILKWRVEGKQCLFDAGRSNLGNYIFSIARNAHSNFSYHAAKQSRELDPPPTELPEEGVDYDLDVCNSDYKVLEILGFESEFIPENLRRFIAWKQNN